VLWVVQGESEIQAWTAATNEHFPTLSLLREFTTSSHAIVTGRQTILCLATAGQRALAGLDNGLVMVMDGTSPGGAEYWPSQGNLVHSLAVSSDGRLAAAGTDRGVISLFHFSGGDDPAHLTAFRGHAVASVALDRRGEWLAAASTAGALRVWRRRNGGFEVYATLREADGRGVRVEFHPTQPSLAAQVEGRRALDVWSLDELERHIDFLGAAR
jgi:WD40 repeat protein